MKTSTLTSRLLAIVAAFSFVFSAAAYDFTVDGVYYNITGDNTVEVTSKTTSAGGYTGEVTVPATVTNGGVNYQVTAVGDKAFYVCSNVTAVHLPSTITSIGENAFYRCTKMADVNIPDGVVTIADNAFKECKALTAITIPSSVTTIGNSAFYQCTVLAQITFNEGLQTIGTSAFNDCRVLTDVVFPASVTSIGQSSFSNCSDLSSVTFSGASSIGLYAFNYCNAITSVTCLSETPPSMYNSSCFTSTVYSNATLYVPIYAIDSYRAANYWNQFVTIKSTPEPDFVVDGIYYMILSNNEVAVTHGPDTGCYSGNVNIPPIVVWNGTLYQVTEIADYTFYGCPEVTDVTLPTSITAIGAYAFAGTGLTTFITPDFMTAIPTGLFSDCTQLTSVTIHASVVSVGERAFAGCTALETVNCKAVTPPAMANSNCFATEAYSQALLFVPGASADTYKTTNWWKNFATIVGALYDFEVDGIYYAITSANNVAVTARDTRYNCYSGSIEIPSTVENNGITYVVTSIAQSAFLNSTDLTGVTIPMSVVEIGDFAFYGCSNLSQVICNGYTPPTMASSYVFYPCYQNATLIVPNGTEEQYQSTDWWNQFTQVKLILRGDVNGDGTVSIADVTALIDYLLSGDESNALLINADVNKDGTVSIADVTALIDYLLSGAWPFDGTVTIQGITFNMVAVEGGTFTMGATPEQGSYPNDNEKPAHKVTLSDYYIGETEVTQALWLAVMGSNPSQHQGDLNYPVERVSWNECQIFISRLNEMTGLNFRMPTEAEWEYAARGGKYSHSHMYAGSDLVDEVAWNYDNSGNLTHLVATKRANELGLYDMSGNVGEWCQDWFGPYSEVSQTNPTGPETGSNRAYRGGFFQVQAPLCRVATRFQFYPSATPPYVGLRLAL